MTIIIMVTVLTLVIIIVLILILDVKPVSTNEAQRPRHAGLENWKILRVALLSASFNPAETWSQRSSGHCRGRDRESQLRVYFDDWS